MNDTLSPQPTVHTLLIATTNAGKIKEIAAQLEGVPYHVIGLNNWSEPLPVVEETGATFAENAWLKATQYHQITGLLTLADDSGLEVDALEGRPGVYSARYGGEGLSNDEQIALLLEEMKQVPAFKRTARFVCTIALVGQLNNQRIAQMFEGRCEGQITFEPRGQQGFGYDPIFIAEDSESTFAQLTREQKSSLSHRGKALQQARLFLERIVGEKPVMSSTSVN